ncbi:MAG TPA: hypothetical protein VIL56_02545 [Gaiellaceae bacterium]
MLADAVAERVVDQLELPLAAHHRRVEVPRERKGLRPYRHEAECVQRFRLALERERRERLSLHRVPHESKRLLPDPDLSRLGGLLEARRNVDRVPRREPLLRADYDFAGVHADAKRQRRREVTLQLLVELSDRLPHLARGAHSSERVVLVQYRHSEDGHHRVADELLDRASVPLDHAAHRLEVAGHHPTETFRVEPFAERRRAAHVAEDNRDGLALLALDGRRNERGRARVAKARSVPVLRPAA